jgi:hypothetical protein
MKFIKGYA